LTAAESLVTKPSRRHIWQLLALVLAIVVVGSALAVPAGAQLFGDRPWFDRPRHSPHYSAPFFGKRGSTWPSFPRWRGPYVQQPPADSKAPPPRKAETPPTSEVLVIGDSLADWLAYGLEEVFADTPEIGIVRKIRPYSGLVHYEAHNDALQWPQALKDTLATEKPKVIVVMLGLNDREPLRERISQAPPKSATGQNEPAPAQASAEPGQQGSGPAHSAATAPPAAAPAASDASRQVQTVSYDFHTDKWAEAYGKRIDEMIAALKTNGVPVLWIGLPAIRGTRTIGDISYLNELYRKRAEKAGITYVDIWDGFVDDQGQYTVQGPDFEGQIRRLRSSDGVHFTKYGAEKLAHYIEHDVRRALKRGIPVAVPGSDEPNAEGAGARTAIGPIVPLNDNAVESGELLGAHNGPAPASSDSIATRVLSRGDAIHAPAGRADNFSWPRADANAPIPTAVEVVPVAPVSSVPAAPPASAAKDAGSKNAAKMPTDAKKGLTPDASSSRPRRLDSASQPPPLRTAPAAGKAAGVR
jgi:uncharacterized protein